MSSWLYGAASAGTGYDRIEENFLNCFINTD